MTMYHKTKFGCQGVNSSEDIVERVVFLIIYTPSLWPWHWRRWTKFSAWHSGSWCCITIPSLVTKYSAVQKISHGQSPTYWAFAVTLTLNAVIIFLSFFFFLYKTPPAYDAVLSNQVWLQIDQQFRKYSRNSHILIILALPVTMTLKTVNQFFCMTLWLMMLHHHTKFGNKIFRTSEDIIRTFIDMLNLHCDLDPECSDPIFPQDTPAYHVVLSN